MPKSIWYFNLFELLTLAQVQIHTHVYMHEQNERKVADWSSEKGTCQSYLNVDYWWMHILNAIICSFSIFIQFVEKLACTRFYCSTISYFVFINIRFWLLWDQQKMCCFLLASMNVRTCIFCIFFQCDAEHFATCYFIILSWSHLQRVLENYFLQNVRILLLERRAYVLIRMITIQNAECRKRMKFFVLSFMKPRTWIFTCVWMNEYH